MSQLDRELYKIQNKIEKQKAQLTKPSISVKGLRDMAMKIDDAYIGVNKQAFNNYQSTPTEENYNIAKKSISSKKFVLPQANELNNELLNLLEMTEGKQKLFREQAKVYKEAKLDPQDSKTLDDFSELVLNANVDAGIITGFETYNAMNKTLTETKDIDKANYYNEAFLPFLANVGKEGLQTSNQLNQYLQNSNYPSEVQNKLYTDGMTKIGNMGKNSDAFNKQLEKGNNLNTIANINNAKTSYNRKQDIGANIIDQLSKNDSFLKLGGDNRKRALSKFNASVYQKGAFDQTYGFSSSNPSLTNIKDLAEDSYSDLLQLTSILEETKYGNSEYGYEDIKSKYLDNIIKDENGIEMPNKNYLDINSPDFQENYDAFKLDIKELTVNMQNIPDADFIEEYYDATFELFEDAVYTLKQDERFPQIGEIKQPQFKERIKPKNLFQLNKTFGN